MQVAQTDSECHFICNTIHAHMLAQQTDTHDDSTCHALLSPRDSTTATRVAWRNPTVTQIEQIPRNLDTEPEPAELRGQCPNVNS